MPSLWSPSTAIEKRHWLFLPLLCHSSSWQFRHLPAGYYGIKPTLDNIWSEAYPFTIPLVAVTARTLSPQNKLLLDWICSSEGQDLLEQMGYVPQAARQK